MRYAILLRGVNVGGRIIKMADLKACFEAMGYRDVVTILQSGNVLLESRLDTRALKPKIEEMLSSTFDYPAKVWAVPVGDLQKIIAANPFSNAPADYHQYIIFFEGNLSKDFAAEAATDDVQVGRGVTYWRVQRGQTLKSPVSKLLSGAKYKNFNTNRNINTLKKMV